MPIWYWIIFSGLIGMIIGILAGYIRMVTFIRKKMKNKFNIDIYEVNWK